MLSPIAWASLAAGAHRLPCPSCWRERRNDRTMGVTVDPDGRGVAHCFRCGFVEVHHPGEPDRQRPTAHRAAPPRVKLPGQHQTLSERAHALWRSALAIEPGTAAAAYLEARRCVLPPVDGHLRQLQAHRHPGGHIGPCLLALLTDATTGEATSLHFTWLDGRRKAEVNPPRLLLPGHRKAGTVCRLWPDEFVTGGLGVAEGIETTLSLAHGFTPAWACIDAGNLAALPVLAGVESLVIACDRDEAGERAAAACARRWAGAGREVLTTRQRCNDLNDLIQEVAA